VSAVKKQAKSKQKASKKKAKRKQKESKKMLALFQAVLASIALTSGASPASPRTSAPHGLSSTGPTLPSYGRIRRFVFLIREL
jgi:hypothetical protein